jgi:hypothetical protein
MLCVTLDPLVVKTAQSAGDSILTGPSERENPQGGKRVVQVDCAALSEVYRRVQAIGRPELAELCQLATRLREARLREARLRETQPHEDEVRRERERE